MLCTLPLMVLNAFQIVILYLFGGSIIAVDMFTNLFTTKRIRSGRAFKEFMACDRFLSVLSMCLFLQPVSALF